MGLKNAGGKFQRMMEWVLKYTPNIEPCIDDVIIESTGANMNESVANHLADFTQILEVMKTNQLICSPSKSKFFQLEVEFCGHVLRKGVHMPSPGICCPCRSESYHKLRQLCAVFYA